MGEMAEYYMDLALEEQFIWEAEQREREDEVNLMERQYMMGVLKWGSINGPIMVTKMSEEHISNCIEMIKRSDYPNDEISHKWVELLGYELEKRK